jgi:hypothetical protein
MIAFANDETIEVVEALVAEAGRLFRYPPPLAAETTPLC